MITIVEKMNTESPVHTKGRFVADFCLDRMLLLSTKIFIYECEQRFCVHYLIKRFGGYRNKLYICKQEQKRNEYAKEYKREKQNGHLPCDAPCEHSPLFTIE